MKEFRTTLISDPTDEYTQNKNNNFKVRLPVRLNLEGNTWQASLWSLSVADGHKFAVINSNSDATLLKYRYTLSKRYQGSSNDWLIGFQAKDKAVTLKEVMGVSYPVVSGIQLWQNIITRMEQTMMDDVNTSSAAWKVTKNNASNISLKATWKPTFEWNGDNLMLKGVSREDVYARNAGNAVIPLSSVGIHVEFAEKFGLLVKDTSNQYQLGPNLDCLTHSHLYDIHPTSQKQSMVSIVRRAFCGHYSTRFIKRN